MTIKYNIKLGDFITLENRVMLCVYSSINSAIFISNLKNSELTFQNFNIISFDLEKPNDINELNNLYDSALPNQSTYSVKNGSVVLTEDRSQMVLLGLFKLKIYRTILDRPLLFNLKDANRFISMELNNGDFQTYRTLEPEQTFLKFKRFYEFIFSSKKESKVKVLSLSKKIQKKITPQFLSTLTTPTPKTAMNYAYDLFDMETLNEIKNKELKEKLTKLVSKTIEIGVENNQIGITSKVLNTDPIFKYTSRSGERKSFEVFKVGETEFSQTIDKNGQIGFYKFDIQKTLSEPYFIQSILEGRSYSELNIPYIDKSEMKFKNSNKTQKSTTQRKEPNFEDIINEGLDEISTEDLILKGLDELN